MSPYESTASRPKPSTLILLGALVLPVLLTVVVSFFMEPAPQAVAVPFFGPWAGMLYGHWDCTMANQMPGGTIGLVAALFAWVGGLFVFRRGLPRAGVAVVAVLWVLLWQLAALASVANAHS